MHDIYQCDLFTVFKYSILKIIQSISSQVTRFINLFADHHALFTSTFKTIHKIFKSYYLLCLNSNQLVNKTWKLKNHLHIVYHNGDSKFCPKESGPYWVSALSR